MKLALYDNNHNLIDILVRYSELSIESVLSTPDKILSFCYPKNLAEIIDYEGYIQTDTDEFVVKNKRDNDDNVSVQAYLNIEGLEGNVFETFNNGAITLQNCLSLALDGSGWSIGSCPETAKRTMELMDVTDAWEIIKKCITTYGVEFKLDSLNKIVNAYTKLGTDKGIYFTDQLNLIKLDTEGNSDDFYTGIKAFGKDISVTLENHQYSNKKKYYIWKDERYTDLSSLTEDAKAKLDEMSKPSITYRCTVADLSKINSYYNFLSYELGDAVTLIDNVGGKKIKARIVRMTEYPNNPTNNTVDIGTNLITLERWFDNKFANYDYKLDNMNYNLNQLESNITNVNLKVDNLDNRVTNLEKGSGGATLDESIYIIDTTLLDSTDKTFALKSKYGTTIITDWGDGTTNNSLTHTYAQEGTYTIKTNSPYTPNTSSTYGNVWRACLIEIVKLNEVIENCTSSFYNFKNLKKVGDILGVTIANSMFKQCTSLVYPANLGEKIKDCRDMYAGCTSLLDTGSYRESMEQT
ncbi:phage tail protein, partial [Clostridium sp. HCP1S3_A12]